MADLQKGTVFSDTSPGNAVTAARLHALVESAMILPGFFTSKADASGAVADGDALMILQLSSGELRLITTASLVTKATVAATAANPLLIGNALPAVGFRDAAHAWIKTNPSGFGSGGLRLWDSDATAWRRVYSVPLGTVVGTDDVSHFTTDGDEPGLGTGSFDGWALCNGNNGTTDYNTGSTIQYMKFVGYNNES